MATDGRNFGSLFLSPWKKKNICPVQGGCGRVLLAESVKTTHRSNSICACPSAGPTFNEHKRKRGEPQHTTGASCLLFSSTRFQVCSLALHFSTEFLSRPVRPSVRLTPLELVNEWGLGNEVERRRDPTLRTQSITRPLSSFSVPTTTSRLYNENSLTCEIRNKRGTSSSSLGLDRVN